MKTCVVHRRVQISHDSVMDVNMYGDAVVSRTCQKLSKKATDSDNVL
jgi:hypothetical protein